MKQTLLLIFTLLLLNSANSADKKISDQFGAVTIDENSTLNKLLTVPGVKEVYKDCQTRFPNNLDEIPNCIWTDPKIKDKQAQIKAIYAEDEKKNSRTPASENSAFKTNLTDKKINISIDYSTDPTVKALTDFYSKKLDEVLSGDLAKDGKEKKITTVDHSKFKELYKSELGKTIVNAFTSYCMETPANCRTGSSLCLISETTKEDNVKENIKNLANATFSKEEGNAWTKCIGDVSKVCYNTTGSSDDEKYSQRRACLIMDYVKTARKNLLALEEQKAFYDELQKNGAANIASNMNPIDGDKKASSDQLTQINSADIEKGNIAKATENTLNEEKSCDDGSAITNQDACKKFLSTDKNKNAEAVAELGLGQLAKEDELNEKLKTDKNVKDYLKEEGFSDPEIAKMTSKENIDSVRADILNRYKNEKASIIKEMADRIQKKTSSDDGKITNADHSKMDTIKKELESKNKDLENLIHFNNIVSSYLEIGDGKTTTRNTASLNAEVQSFKGEGADTLKDNVKKNSDLKQNDSNTQLEVETLNKKILNYIPEDPNGK